MSNSGNGQTQKQHEKTPKRRRRKQWPQFGQDTKRQQEIIK